jgi:sodium/potassium/calcium exchanger 6
VVTAYCDEPFSDGFVNYIKLHYCDLSDCTVLSFAIQTLCLLFLFVLLGSTADEWFVPTLVTISDTLRLSPSVAGVTFLALGNGAPDIASIVRTTAACFRCLSSLRLHPCRLPPSQTD